MLGNIKRFFEKSIAGEKHGVTSEKVTEEGLRLATAALLIEITRADRHVKQEEREVVIRALRKSFDLTETEIDELIILAEEEVKEAISLFQFTHLIDKGFPYEKKKEIVRHLWQVALSDDEMEKHEVHLIRKVADLLHVAHSDFIAAKQEARKLRQQEA
ncbi:hypothetical protein MNBD_DELTA01-67 [hydrothermal vent metagenome]|uniref:Co-chaperone DjlA N-terminal domain-containing protein n=1 Tax=hydrothermal vent metagenome TaxID=652676 RepID=A0A3B0QKH7_9ZZZZ